MDEQAEPRVVEVQVSGGQASSLQTLAEAARKAIRLPAQPKPVVKASTRIARAIRVRARAIQDEAFQDAFHPPKDGTPSEDLIAMKRWISNELHELANAIDDV